MHMLPGLLHGEERKVWGDAGYQCLRENSTSLLISTLDWATREYVSIQELQP
jgi:hypothetical protein